ncbi:EAL and HDOD domain-containing protein [Euzebya sp.]|uniref:EAL and HDOD domain-containing protein n=1 Tax=Euzebya sp. TaxID=1971409 RepID=UPI0035182EDB
MTGVRQGPGASAVGADIRVGRQPILDRCGRVVGYELLYRPAEADLTWDGDRASSVTMLNTFFDLGLERLVGKRLAFVNLTRRFLVEPLIPFDRDQVVLEVLEDVEVDDELIAAVRRLARDGYTLALDDYTFDPRWDPLLGYVKILKVDLQAVDLDTIARELPRHRRPGVTLVAEKVETPEQHLRARALGFHLFQGYHYARPHVVEGRRVPGDRMRTLRLISRLNDPAVDLEDMIDVIAGDPGLSTSVLRFVNSAAVGLRNRVDSIRAAVIYVGLDRIRSWASLLAMSGVAGKSLELVNTALVRAHMCELLAEDHPGASPHAAYTVGLLSILDALVDLPMPAVLAQLPLPEDLSRAIGRREGVLGDLLACAIAVEEDRWAECEARGLEPDDVLRAFLSSTERAFEGLARVA